MSSCCGRKRKRRSVDREDQANPQTPSSPTRYGHSNRASLPRDVPASNLVTASQGPCESQGSPRRAKLSTSQQASQAATQHPSTQTAYSVVNEAILKAKGHRVSAWLENPEEPGCPVSNKILAESDFQNAITETEGEQVDMPEHIYMSDPLIMNNIPGTAIEYSFYYDGVEWSGLISSNTIVIDSMIRDNAGGPTPGPHISDITISLFQKHFRLENLSHIFVCDIINEEACHLFKKHIYNNWPNPSKPQRWKHGSKEYNTILGSRVGRTMAYVVLAGFPRGSRRISQVVSWPLQVGAAGAHVLHLRFDVESISALG